MSQQIITKITKMLSDDRIERRCAAAMVLGELRVKDAAAVEALCQHLGDEEGPMQLYALEALAALKAKKIAAFVTPLLDSRDEEVKARAMALLASQGSRAAATLMKQLDDAPPARQRAIVGIIARHHGKDTFERLLGLLGEGELGEAVRNTLRGELDHMSPADASTLRELLSKRLKDKSADSMATARAVRLLGYYRDGKLVQTISSFITPKHAEVVRLAALAGLRRPLSAARSSQAVVRKILEQAGDPSALVARAAVDTLRGVTLAADAADLVSKLTDSPHAEVRRFAVTALGDSGGNKAAKVLIQQILGEDPATRETAARTLVKLDGGIKALVKELAKVDDPGAIARLCHLLRPHAKDFDTRTRKSVAALAMDAFEAGDTGAESLLALMQVADPDNFAALLTEKALKHKKAKRYQDSLALLSRLDGAELLQEDGHYAALVCGLCATTATKDLGRASRTTDPILKHAVALVTAGFPLANKLKRDKSLDTEDLFFVGFNFAESRDEDEREFGGELLGHLVAKSPRSKLGRSAKNKMRLVGLE